MRIVHLITEHFPPARGGMEASTLRLAQLLSVAGFRVIVYIRAADGLNYETTAKQGGFEAQPFGNVKTIWEEPLVESNWSAGLLTMERWRLDFLALRNLIGEEVTRNQAAKHALVSTFITREGCLASYVAEDLQLPHLPFVVGTDFSRGFHNPLERNIIAAVVSASSQIVTKNREQATALERCFNTNKIRVIHNAVDERVFDYSWQAHLTNNVRLFSDGGYSHKKGTHILLKAYAELRQEGLPVLLNICGEVYEGQETYWSRLRDTYKDQFGPFVELDDYIDNSEVLRKMTQSDIYCSATLGEGCSPGRASALCIGIPIVTTLCGEISDVAEGASHVRLSPPCDYPAFLRRLRDACNDMLAGRLSIERSRVESWRAHFAPERYNKEILDVFRDLFA